LRYESLLQISETEGKRRQKNKTVWILADWQHWIRTLPVAFCGGYDDRGANDKRRASEAFQLLPILFAEKLRLVPQEKPIKSLAADPSQIYKRFDHQNFLRVSALRL